MIRVINSLRQNIQSSPMPLLWVYIPCLFFIVWTAIELIVPEQVILHAVSENGIIEWIHVALSFITFLCAFYFFAKTNHDEKPLLKIWFFLFAIGSLYIAGEEVSWGQWIFNWETPEFFDQYNDQYESNLHNMSSWLDQKPRALIELGIVMSGLILPLLHRKNVIALPSWILNLLPPFNAIYLTIVYIMIKLLDVYGNITDFRLHARASEIIELVIYYYLFVYVLSLKPNKETS